MDEGATTVLASAVNKLIKENDSIAEGILGLIRKYYASKNDLQIVECKSLRYADEKLKEYKRALKSHAKYTDEKLRLLTRAINKLIKDVRGQQDIIDNIRIYLEKEFVKKSEMIEITKEEIDTKLKYGTNN